MKRLFDIFFAAIGLIILFPLFIIVALLIKLDSKGQVFFRQERIGRDFKPFRIFKFRTMTFDPVNNGPQVTVAGDKRVTKIGKMITSKGYCQRRLCFTHIYVDNHNILTDLSLIFKTVYY